MYLRVYSIRSAMFHLGKVRKLHKGRVLRDIANESQEEWLPESWNKTKKSAMKYGKQIKQAWDLAVDPSIVHKYSIVFLASYFHHIVAPILHNEPWQAEYFEPVLERAYEVLYTKVFVRYDYDQKYSMVKPIFEAFAEAGMYVPMPHPSKCAWKRGIYSIHRLKEEICFQQTVAH